MMQDEPELAARGEPAANQPSPEATIPKFEEHLHEWQDIKPGLERLVAIEGELTELIGQLNEIVQDNENAAQAAAAQQTASQSQPKTAPAPKPAQLPAVTAKADIEPAAVKQTPTQQQKAPAREAEQKGALYYSLQLYSLSNHKQVRPTWYRLQHKHPALLGKLDAVFEKIKVNNNLYYRVKAGKFTASAKADAICSQLKALGTQCIPTEFKGKPLSELNGS
ncbi:SPOR domain-containing protein [Thalassomonas sp. RHCl1]|uniref:SPOR domain-containing protein n=1 Tax=Thalassomonas sp. RHCl1 TaxID=2995320 RepID=UPI00248B0984|nr:SPOR domain-containing protein [Thalassomonas sp. RHCl1]